MKPQRLYAPTKRLFLILMGLGLLALGCFVLPGANLAWLAIMAIVLGAVVWEVWQLSHSRAVLVSHRWNHQPTVQEPFEFTAVLEMETPNGVRYMVETIESDAMMPSKPQAHLETGERQTVRAVIELFPRRRGDLEWPGAYVHYKVGWGLVDKWQRLEAIPVPVYPKLTRDLQNQLNPELLMQQMGLKTNQNLKADQEFESLRPYVAWDNYRHIDWKASARMNSLITRQFQVEHHHNILVCVDASRLMGTVTEGISKLDWSIQASLHLAYLAHRFQDRMGVLVYSNQIEQWIKPHNHPVEAVLKAVYNLDAKIVEADFHHVCMAVLASQKKRSLVIFLSDFLDASSLEPYLRDFAQLNRKHCSLFIGVEDPAYQRHLTSDTGETVEAMAQKIVALDSMKRRQAMLQQLRQMGLRALTVTPENLVRRAMEAYVEIKFQGAI